MGNTKNYFKIRVSKLLDPTNDMVFNKDLKGMGFTNEFNEKVYLAEDEQFRSKILTFLDDEIGPNWAVHFNQITDIKYDVELYSDETKFEKMAKIITERLPEMEFEFSIKGTVNEYLNQYSNKDL